MDLIARMPATVTTAGIILIIYGCLNISGSLCAGATLAGEVDPRLEKELPSYIAVEATSTTAALLIGAGMIGAGAFVLRLVAWARLAAFGLCLLDIVFTVAHNLYNVVWFIPVQNRIMEEELQNLPPMGFDFGDVMAGGMWMSVIMSMAVTLACCLTVVFLLRTESARAAFADGYFEAPEEEPRHRGYRDEAGDGDDDVLPRRRPPTDGFTERW